MSDFVKRGYMSRIKNCMKLKKKKKKKITSTSEEYEEFSKKYDCDPGL